LTKAVEGLCEYCGSKMKFGSDVTDAIRKLKKKKFKEPDEPEAVEGQTVLRVKEALS
jgi:hypothetical protein